MSIKLFQNERIWQEVGAEIIDLANTMHSQGVAQNGLLTVLLEETLAKKFNRKHCITTGCGTDALDIAVQSLSLPGKSNIGVSNYTFTASAHAVWRAGHTVVPIDVDNSYCLDVDQVPTPLAAVVAVDLFGNMTDYSRLDQLGIPVIVDAAQSLESSNGGVYSAKHGIISCLSFSPSKTVSSWGSGGAILTDDDTLAERCRRLRLHGKLKNDNDAIAAGLNSMMSSFEIAAVTVGLKYSNKWHSRRTAIAKYLKENSTYRCANDFELDQNTFSKLVFQSDSRNVTMQRFKELDIDCVVHYNKLISDEHMYTSSTALTNSNRLKRISFTVPNQHTLSDSEVELIAKALQ